MPCLASSYERKILLSGSQDKTIKAWSLETFTVEHTFTGHKADVHTICILEQRNACVSGSEDRSIRVWDLLTYKPIAVVDSAHAGGIFTMACLPLNYVLSGGRDRSIMLWNDQWKVAKALTPPHCDAVTALCVSGKTQKFYSASRDKTIKEWDGLALCVTEKQQPHAHADWVTCMTMSPEDTLISGSRDCAVKVWDVQSGYMICTHQLRGHAGAVSAVAASNDLLFSASYDRSVRVWRLPA